MAEHQGQKWRAIENPDDGTSQFRARVVWGTGINTTLRAMFVDKIVAQEYVTALTDRDRLVQAEVITEAFASRLALKSHDDGATYHVVWAGDYDSIYNEDLRKLVENFLQARVALDAMQENPHSLIIVDDAVNMSKEDWSKAEKRLNLAGEGEIP